MPAESLSISNRTDTQKNIEVITPTGPLTLSTLFDFQDVMKKATGPKTILDLTGVPYIDSAGLGSILSYHASCQRNNRKYAIIGISPRVHTMFEVSKVDSLMRIYPTMQEAETALGS